MMNCLNKLRRDESGATAIEYGLLVGVISIFAIIALAVFGDSMKDLIQDSADKIDKQVEDAGGG